MASLLGLPSEIRAIIIDHTTPLAQSKLHPACVSCKFHTRDQPHHRKRNLWTKPSPCPPLLLTCSALYAAGLPSIYRKTRILLLPELISPDLPLSRPGMRHVRAIDLYVNASFPKGCVSYSESFQAEVVADINRYLPQVTSLGLSMRDNADWSHSITPSYRLEPFLGDPSWSEFIRRVHLPIKGRNRYSLQAYLQSSRISDASSLSDTARRSSILSLPFALLKLPKLEELTLSMVTSLSAPSQHNSDVHLETEAANPRNWERELYTPSDFLIRNKQGQDFVIALKIGELFHARGKKVSILVRRCIWTEGFGGYVVEEKTLQQYSHERWESSTEFVSDFYSRGDQHLPSG